MARHFRSNLRNGGPENHDRFQWFFPGLHQPSDAGNFGLCCISINRLRGRKKPISCKRVLLDSGAFTELSLYGRYRHEVFEYAAEVRRLCNEGVVMIEAAVAQDYMCEPFMLEKTGLTIDEHQRLTVERYDALVAENLPCPVMPVLQGYAPSDYVRHIEMYGDRLKPSMWVGVGSVCKRNSSPEKVAEVLRVVATARPDLRLHGFGVKLTSLLHAGVRKLLYSADSMAWSFAARRQGRDANSWREAEAFSNRVMAKSILSPPQMALPFGAALFGTK